MPHEASNTAATYRTAARAFARWCESRGESVPFPVPPPLLAAFVDAVGQRLKPATVATYVCGVDHGHRAQGLPAPGSTQEVHQALTRLRQAWQGEWQGERQARPLRRPHITSALERLGDSLLDLRDAALLTVAVDTLAKPAELVALNVGDVVPEGGGALVSIARPGPDQVGEGDRRFLSGDTYARVLVWIEARALGPDDPLFVPLSTSGRRERLNPREVSRIFKRRTGSAFSAQSTRVGAVLDRQAAGIGTALIAEAGGWKGEAMPARYAKRYETESLGGALRAMRDVGADFSAMTQRLADDLARFSASIQDEPDPDPKDPSEP